MLLLTPPLLPPPPDTRDVFLMVDNRELIGELEDAPYWTLTVVINAHYARRHGYRFVYAIPVYNESRVRGAVAAASAACSFGVSPAEQPLEQRLKVPGGKEKDATVAYHFGWDARRAASWAKLMPVWQLARSGVNVFYADSDAYIEGADHTLADVFAGGSFKELRAGVRVGEGALVAFLANTPFGEPFPGGERIACAGAFYVAARGQARAASDFVRQWWDVPGWERWHPYEQAALHSVIYGPQLQACVPPPAGNCTMLCSRVDMARAYSLVGDDQFEHLRKDPWLQHYGSLENPAMRELVLAERIYALGFARDTFAAAVAEIVPLRFDALDVALRMHLESCTTRASDECARVVAERSKV